MFLLRLLFSLICLVLAVLGFIAFPLIAGFLIIFVPLLILAFCFAWPLAWTCQGLRAISAGKATFGDWAGASLLLVIILVAILMLI